MPTYLTIELHFSSKQDPTIHAYGDRLYHSPNLGMYLRTYSVVFFLTDSEHLRSSMRLQCLISLDIM